MVDYVSRELVKVSTVMKKSRICIMTISFQHSVVDGVGEAVGFIDKGGMDFECDISLTLVEPLDCLR